jgi:hypothetical protein
MGGMLPPVPNIRAIASSKLCLSELMNLKIMGLRHGGWPGDDPHQEAALPSFSRASSSCCRGHCRTFSAERKRFHMRKKL